HHKSLVPGSSQRDCRSSYPLRWRPSCLRHPRVARSGEIGCFEQDTDCRASERSHGAQTGDARVAVVATQLVRFGGFGGGAPAVTFEGAGGGTVGVRKGLVRMGVVRPLEPQDRLVDARPQQMHLSDPEIKYPDLRIAGTEANGSLLGRDCLLDRPGYE